MKTYFGISAALVFVVSNCYFGWNWTAQSDSERVCDLIYLVLGFIFFFYKPTQKEWHYHVSCSLINSRHSSFGSVLACRKSKLIHSEMDEFIKSVRDGIVVGTHFEPCDVVVLSFHEIPVK